MNQSIKNKLPLLIYISILLFIFAAITSITGNWVWHSNVNRYINKKYKNQMSIKADNGFSYKGRNYRIIFSTPKDKEDELYLRCLMVNRIAYNEMTCYLKSQITGHFLLNCS